MSTTGPASGAGVVHRGLAVDGPPTVLRRPGARAAPATESPAPHAAPAPHEPGARPSYEDGFRAGLAQGEAVQRARELGTQEATQRRAFELGLEEGRQRGLAEGREQGRAAFDREAHEGREVVTARLALLDRLLEGVPAALDRRLAEAEDDMVALCHGVICRVLGDEARSREGIAALVRQAVRHVGPTGSGSGHGLLAIHVHPRDQALLEGAPELLAWLRRYVGAGAVQWVGDERVRLGGCLVRSSEGSLDARLETQLGALRRQLTAAPVAAPAATAASAGSVEGAT